MPCQINKWKRITHGFPFGEKEGCATRNRSKISAGAQLVGICGSFSSILRESSEENITNSDGFSLPLSRSFGISGFEKFYPGGTLNEIDPFGFACGISNQFKK